MACTFVYLHRHCTTAQYDRNGNYSQVLLQERKMTQDTIKSATQFAHTYIYTYINIYIHTYIHRVIYKFSQIFT
jgi:ribosomal protein L16/L10AE